MYYSFFQTSTISPRSYYAYLLTSFKMLITFAGSPVNETADCVDNRSVERHNPYAYSGTKNVTITGKTCLYWSTVLLRYDYMVNMTDYLQLFPDGNLDQNYCRNPVGGKTVLNQYLTDLFPYAYEPSGPWCFTALDPLTKEYCFYKCRKF